MVSNSSRMPAIWETWNSEPSSDAQVLNQGSEVDCTQTFEFTDQGHTLGNPIQHILNSLPEVVFCGYSIPHPSENRMLIQLQVKPGYSPKDTLKKAVDLLKSMLDHMATTFKTECESSGIISEVN